MRVRSTRLRTALILATALLMLAFVAWKLHAGLAAVDRQTMLAHAPAIAAAMALFAAGTLLLGAAWVVVVRGVARGRGAAPTELMTAFAFAWLGRYIPGSVPFFAGKVYLGRQLGHETRPLVIATGVENVIEILVAAVVGCSLIAASTTAPGSAALLGVAALAPLAALVALHPSVFRRITNRALRVMRRDPIPQQSFPPMRNIVAAAALVAANQLVNGLGLLVLMHSVAGMSWSGAVLCTGALALAGVAGMLVVVAPAGFGVRDGVLTALLATRVAVDGAASGAVLMRVVTLFADLALVLLALAFDALTSGGVARRIARGARHGTPAGDAASISQLERVA